MSRVWSWTAGVTLGVTLLSLAWWGWQRAGLSALQLGMSICQ